MAIVQGSVKIEEQGPYYQGEEAVFYLVWDGPASGGPNGGGVAHEVVLKGTGDFKLSIFAPTGNEGINDDSRRCLIRYDIPTGIGDAEGNINAAFEVKFRDDAGITVYEQVVPVTFKALLQRIKPKLTIAPSGATVTPGKTVTLKPTVTNVPSGSTVTWEWLYDGKHILEYDNKSLVANYIGVGKKAAQCNVKAEKDGYSTGFVGTSVWVTGAKGNLDVTPTLDMGHPGSDYFKVLHPVEAVVTLPILPDGVEVTYTWYINEVAQTEPSKLISFIPEYAGEHDVKCVMEFTSPDYNTTTRTISNIMDVDKLGGEDVNLLITASPSGWGPGSESLISVHAQTFINGTPTTLKIIDDGLELRVDNKRISRSAYKLTQGIIEYNNTFIPPHDSKNYVIEAHVRIEETDLIDSIYVDGNQQLRWGKRQDGSYQFVLDGRSASGGHYIVSRGKTRKFNIINIFDYSLYRYPGDIVDGVPPKYPDLAPSGIPQDYFDKVMAFAKLGKYTLTIEKDGVPLITTEAVDGTITTVVPDKAGHYDLRFKHEYIDREQASKWARDVYSAELMANLEVYLDDLVPYPSVTIDQNPDPVLSGDDVEFSLTFKDVPESATVDNIVWYVDDIEQAGSEHTLTSEAHKGIHAFAKATVKPATGERDANISGSLFNVNVEYKKWPSLEMKLSPRSLIVMIGDYVYSNYEILGRELIEKVEKLIVAHPEWDIDGTKLDPMMSDGAFNFRMLSKGFHTITGTTQITHPDYEGPINVSRSFRVEIMERDTDDAGICPVIYVHPLPWRESAYIWIGWWVMDEIQRITKEGKDWRLATPDDSKYYCHIALLAKMLEDYDEVDVQESRNGYIIHHDQLSSGIIYP